MMHSSYIFNYYFTIFLMPSQYLLLMNLETHTMKTLKVNFKIFNVVIHTDFLKTIVRQCMSIGFSSTPPVGCLRLSNLCRSALQHSWTAEPVFHYDVNINFSPKCDGCYTVVVPEPQSWRLFLPSAFQSLPLSEHGNL